MALFDILALTETILYFFTFSSFCRSSNGRFFEFILEYYRSGTLESISTEKYAMKCRG